MRVLRIICLTGLALIALSVENVQIVAQGAYFAGLAQSVAALPGQPQGLSNVVVPIPSAAVYVCTGTYASTPCSASQGSQASLYSCQALSGCALTQPLTADLYGNFGFWAAAGVYYYTLTGQVNGQTVAGSYQISLPLACGASCAAGVFNATTGFEIGGAAASNHVLLGNGTNYVDSATIPASIVTGLPGTFYQTVEAQDSAVTQRANLDFADPAFVLTDSSPNQRTVVNLSKTGTDTVLASAAGGGTSGYPAKWLASGDLGTGPAFPTSGSNANGYWVKDMTGRLHQWGHLLSTTASNCAASAVTFPVAFTVLASIVPGITDDASTGTPATPSVDYGTHNSCASPTTATFEIWTLGTNGVWWWADGY